MDNIFEINNKIIELRKIKKDLIQNSKKSGRKIRIKMLNKETNVLRRMSKLFYDKMNNILYMREKIGMNNRFISMPKITDLIVRHKNWVTIEEDIIHYNFEGSNGKNE